MVESDDDFAELCSKLLKRVRKNNNPQDVPKVSTAARGAAKKAKATGTKKQKKDVGAKEAEAPAIPRPDGDKPERNHPPTNGLLQKDGSEAVALAPERDPRPLEQLSVKDLVLERMQQFKRAAPSRMKLDSTETSEAQVGSSVASPSVQNDGALALALQMDVKEKPASLEDEGLFFCQLCQKDLTAMSGALREQHVNRCLDQVENVGGGPVIPVVPSCPLCGKPFSTEKSRASHLKRCAVKLDVPAQTLLQAVQRQAAEAGSEAPPQVINGKRKGVPKQKGPAKKRKTAETGPEMEDMLVAMALSRSMQEDKNGQNTAGGQSPLELPAREKKSRRKQKDKPTPLLLLQAPEETGKKLQKRLSMLLTEESAENNVMTLPPSHFWALEEEERESWRLFGGKRCGLWDISNMMKKRDPLSYYIAELNPPITPWKSPVKKLHRSQSHVNTTILHSGKTQIQTDAGKGPQQPVSCEDKPPLSNSQNVLLDLADLAGEGITLTQWNSGAGSVSEQTGPESPVTITSSGFIPAQEEKTTNVSCAPDNKMPLLVLSADFLEMVNNPHLSDAQLQTDCGEVFSAHMFVLYARCPLLVEAIHSEGFWVDESGMGRARRLLLNDVSAEAALCFLRFLYSAATDIPGHCLPHVSELARRFGVKSLIDTCEVLVSGTPNSEVEISTEEEGDDGGERAETFQELLKSMWVDEGEDVGEGMRVDAEEEEKLDDGAVGEGELEEIYEFAFTQRKMLAEKDCEGERLSGFEDDGPKSRSLCVDEKEEMDVIQTTPPKVSPIPTDMDCSPTESRVCLLSNSPEYSLSLPIASSAQLRSQPSSSHSVAPLQSPKLKVADGSPAKQDFTSHNTSESPIPVISLISPNRDEDPEADMFALHSPPPLNDSYDRMFSQTCGEYGEPSGIDESKSQINPASPQGQQPILTSSPTATPSSTLPELGPSPDIQPQTHSFLDRPSYSSESGKSLRSSFKDSKHSRLTQISKDTSPKASTQEADVILILSSDEEMESNDQAAAPTRSVLSDKPDICKAIKESPASFSTQRRSSEGFSRLEMSSSSEMSWLVPATPLPQSTSSKVSFLQTSCLPQSPQILQKMSDAAPSPSDLPNAAQSPPKAQKTSHATPSPPDILKMSHTSLSTPNTHRTSHASSSPPDSYKTSHASSSPPDSYKTSHASSSPPDSYKTSHASSSPPDSYITCHASLSPLKSQKTCHASLSPLKSQKTCHASLSPLKSQKTCHASLSPLKSQKTCHASLSPLKSQKTCHASLSPLKSQKTCHASLSPLKSQKTCHASLSPLKSRKTCHASLSPLKSQKTCHASLSPLMSQKTCHASESPLKSQKTCHASPSPPKSQKMSHASESPPKNMSQTSINFDLNVSFQSFISQTQECPVSLPLMSPKSPRTPQSSRPSIHKKLETGPETHSSACSKTPSSPPISIASSTVFEVDDSEDEAPSAEPQANISDTSFQFNYDEPPIPMEDDLWNNMEKTPRRSSSPSAPCTPVGLNETPKKSLYCKPHSPSPAKRTIMTSIKDSPPAPVSQSSHQSFLSSRLWEDWEDDNPELPVVLPLSQRLKKVPEGQKELKTPVSIVRRRELAPVVPITPLPDYSDMDTPILKKELSKFGVRALPKKKMVLKLKEIFRYTHQVMSSDSEDDAASSLPHRSKGSSAAQVQQKALQDKQRSQNVPKGSSSSHIGRKGTSVCTAQEEDTGDDRPLTASQESSTSSAAASDTSSLSQSSNTNEFETAFADEEDDEPVAASQAASKEALTVEAVRRFIEARPDLHRQILLYQPLDLAALHAELKLNGIKIAAGKLLDFLDSHCVTFTTATARKEKQSRRRRKVGKRH